MPVSLPAILGLLQRCSSTADLKIVRQLYSLVVSSGLESVGILSCKLVRLFAACGSLHEANLVFSMVSRPSVDTWHAIISANAVIGETDQVLQLFNDMLKEGVYPNRDIFSCILKRCRTIGCLRVGTLIHDMIVKMGLDLDVVMQNAVVDMYARCGSLQKARKVFDASPHRNVVSWGVMISGYARQGKDLVAFEFFEDMQNEGIKPNKVIFLGVLKACSRVGSLEKGRLIHDQITTSALDSDGVLGNTLVGMYAKCGSLREAHKVFDQLTNKDMVSYGVLIAGYAQHGQGLPALELFERMQQKGIMLNEFTFSCILKACCSIGAIMQGKLIHDQIMKTGLEADVVIGSTLIDMYAKCGSLNDARKMFDGLPIPDVVTWGAMIGSYVEHGYGLAALDLFKEMQCEGIRPDKVVMLCTLKACGLINAISQGKKIHGQIIENGLDLDTSVGNALVDVYGKCGSLGDAQHVFDKLHIQDAVSWGTIISGYSEHGYGCTALELYEKMQNKGIPANKVIFLCILKACSSIGAVEQGKLIHEHLIKSGIDFDVIVGNALIDMYSKCSSLEAARRVFDRLQDRDVVSWGAMIAGYAFSGYGFSALEIFEKMEGIKLNEVTFCCILKACGSVKATRPGKLVHDKIIASGLDLDLVVGNCLIDMYAKCGNLREAHKIFNTLSNRDAISWGTMIAGHVQLGNNHSALAIYEKMQCEGVTPDKTTFACVLKAFGSIGTSGQANPVNRVLSSGLDSDPVVGSTMVDMYAKSGRLEEACNIFHNLKNPDIVSWCAMIAAYAQHGHCFRALKLFQRMRHEGIEPNKITFLCALKACGSMGAIVQGMLLHQQIIRSGFDSDVVIGNTLVDVYAKSGYLREACQVFDKLPSQNSVGCGALIAGYAQEGDYGRARQCLEGMEQLCLKPNDITYTSMLTACSHAGEVEEGHHHFESMRKEHGIAPSIEHFTCMINLLCCAGCLNEAKLLLQTVPVQMDITAWMCLLTSCRKYSNVELGQHCFNHVVKMDPNFSSAYVIMSNIYADANMWQDVHKILCLKKDAGVTKQPGRAWIEIDSKVHEFIVGEKLDSQNGDIYGKLKILRKPMEKKGYVPLLDLVLAPTHEKAKEDVLFGYQCKDQYLDFGLCSTLEGATMRVSKSLRAWNDCGSPCWIISKIKMKEITIRNTYGLLP